jgi:hypothetical protein
MNERFLMNAGLKLAAVGIFLTGMFCSTSARAGVP